MEFKKSFSTRAGRDFEIFAKSGKFNRNTFFDYENERAICEYQLEARDHCKNPSLSFTAKFFSNKFQFCIVMRDFAFVAVSKNLKAATSKALIRLNASADGCDAGFVSFSHRPYEGIAATIVVAYGKKDSLELMRKAFLSLWGAVLTRYDYLSAVASGRDRTRREKAKNLRDAIGIFASFFTDVTKDYIWNYDPVKKIVEYLDELENERSWGDVSEFSHDEEGYDGFLNGDLDLHGDGFLWPQDDDDNEYAQVLGPEPEDVDDDADADDALNVDGGLNADDEPGLSACFLRAVMTTAFHSKSSQRRKEDGPLLGRDPDDPDGKEKNDGDAED